MTIMGSIKDDKTVDFDELSVRLRIEAEEALEDEPELQRLLESTVLAPGVLTFEEAVTSTVCYRLLLHPCETGVVTNTNVNNEAKNSRALMFCPNSLRDIFMKSFDSEDQLEYGHTMSQAVREDALAVCRRDPACQTILEVVLFYKGFSALVCHRAARHKWFARNANNQRRSMTALWLQSQASAVFGLDIHPAATIGAGILLDHGTGVVIGETAVLGDGCTLLHGVTLGGTGKETGDRHPKVGNHVLIGAGASVLGNIQVGSRAKIGAGSIVLRPIPAGATAVGAPAKIIGRVLETNPGEELDDGLHSVRLLRKSDSTATTATAATATTTTTTQDGEEEKKQQENKEDEDSISSECSMCPYREYKRMGLSAPAGSVTINTMFNLFGRTGCTVSEIGAAFLQLDAKCVGYIEKEMLSADVDVICQCISSVAPEVVRRVVDAYSKE